MEGLYVMGAFVILVIVTVIKGVRIVPQVLEREEWPFSCKDRVEVGQRVIVDKIVGDELQVSVK